MLPSMGESVSEATIIKWLKQPGDRVAVDDIIVEIATDKVDSEVPSPVSGVLLEQRFQADQVAQVGDVIAIIQEDGEGEAEEQAVDNVSSEPLPMATETEGSSETIPGLDQLPTNDDVQEVSRESTGSSDRFYSPLVKTIAEKEGLSMSELDNIEGSGLDGRVTKQDVLAYVEGKKGSPAAQTRPTPIEQSPSFQKDASDSVPDKLHSETYTTRSISGDDEIIVMDRMRRLIADHMVKSVQTSPHVCSFVEADVTNIVEWRNKVKAAFEKRENEKITFTPIFIEAIARALKAFPMINISVDGNNIIKKKHINIGMATALPSGNLIVPVIKNADQLNLLGLAKSVNHLAKKARGNKLDPSDVQDGTFTLTNIGSFGNVMGTPIINQPQVAIMAVGAIKKKPAVIETPQGDLIGVRHMMFLSMSYDHRVVDGALGGMFIRKVADYLEAWDPNREI